MRAVTPLTSPRRFKEMLLHVLPEQGCWSEEKYLGLMGDSNRLVEYTDGFLEFLPMPTDRHQAILAFLFESFRDYLRPGGKVHFAGIRLRVRPGKFREPDLMLLRDAKDPRRQDRFWLGADLVLEVVSPDDPSRDLRGNRKAYAEAEVPEYWIVNPLDRTITVLKFQGNRYKRFGLFREGDKAQSATLAGFAVDVSQVFNID
jgi:Uma2 family endonuclease